MSRVLGADRFDQRSDVGFEWKNDHHLAWTSRNLGLQKDTRLIHKPYFVHSATLFQFNPLELPSPHDYPIQSAIGLQDGELQKLRGKVEVEHGNLGNQMPPKK